MVNIPRGSVVSVLRRIATELPIYRNGKFEDYPAFAGRLKQIARQAVDLIDKEAKEVGKKISGDAAKR